MDQPAWMAAAWAELGVREAAGAADSAIVTRYFTDAGHAAITQDETPWCAAFVGAMLMRSGQTATGSLMARSYLNWGEPVDMPRLGAITVLSRGSDPTAGHVGFYLGSSGDKVILLGGNQADAVNAAAYHSARVLGHRWPVDAAVPATLPEVARDGDDPVFARALLHVLAMEGGYSHDPYDPGGPTNLGITLATLAKWRGETVSGTSRARLIADLKRIPDDTVAAIYLARYWQPASCASLPAALALMHFDAAVNHGVGGAIRMLQRAAGAAPDGEIGPLTHAAVAARPLIEILTRYADIRRQRYRALPHFWRFGRGWLKRVDATQALARAWAREDDRSIPNSQAKAEGRETMSTNDIPQEPGKWWLKSKTVWGALIASAATVIPVIGPLIGIELPADVIRDAGEQTIGAVQAVVGLVGTLLAIYGRLTASGPLTRRDMNVRL